MLDLNTLLLLESCTITFQAVAWVIVWRSWRHLYEVRFIAAGFVAIALGLLLYLQRGGDPSPVRIVIDNTVIKIGLVLLANGMVRFLGQRSLLPIGAVCLAFHVIFWSIAVAVAPQELAPRIHASTAFSIAIMGLMIHALYIDRGQPRMLRWITIALLAEFIGASLLQSALFYWSPTTVKSGPVLGDVNSWYFIQGYLFMMGLFICLLFMLGMRLSLDLRDRNMTLAREVHARRRLENKLSASLAAEKSARQEQRQLMRMVSHEFRTPLAAIRYANEMIVLMLQRPQEAIAKRLQTIDDAVTRMSMLIDRFLADERRADGVLKIERIDISGLAQQIRNHFDQVGKGRRLDFKRLDPVRDFWADPEMLRTIVVNLVDNAIKYSPSDESVEIAFIVRNDFLVIEVSDRGIGIPTDEQVHVGRRFFRASNTGSTAGSGLGLHGCRQLLDYHGGSLNLSPRDGGGIIATARLPLDRLRPEDVGQENGEVLA